MRGMAYNVDLVSACSLAKQKVHVDNRSLSQSSATAVQNPPEGHDPEDLPQPQEMDHVQND